jgi:GT2 family glycosyltransferase
MVSVKRQRWGVVVLNWNGSSATLDCVRSVNEAAAQATAIDVHCVVIDNGSDTGSLGEIERALESQARWKLLAHDENLGFSRGMNSGINALAAAAPDYVLLLNNDTRLDKHALAALFAHQAEDPAPILGLAITAGTGLGDRLLCGYRYYPWFGAAAPVYLNAARPAYRPTVDYICGSAMLCSTDFLNSIGGIPEASFLYFEELRLMNATRERATPAYCAEAVVAHSGGAGARKLQQPSRHYFAAHACYSYTIENGAIRLPSVVAARMLRLSFLSLREFSLLPLADGLRALWDSIAGVEKRPGPVPHDVSHQQSHTDRR